MTLRTCAACLLILVPSLAAAAPNLEEAKQHFAAGKQAFERGEYEAALAEFQKANEIAPAPSLLYNMGKTYEELGRYKDAAFAFERYLQDYGQPQNDEDKQFQENLRARIAADRTRPDRTGAQPPPQPQQYPQQQYPQQQYPQQQYPQQQYPPNYYPQQSPYGYPYVVPPTYRITKNDMLLEAHSRRNRAIALIVVGSVLDVIGIALLVDGLVHPYGDGFNSNAFGAVNYFEDWLGASLIIVGVTLWGPGAASYAKASRRINQVNAMPDNTVAKSGWLPPALVFNAPTIHF